MRDVKYNMRYVMYSDKDFDVFLRNHLHYQKKYLHLPEII